MTVTTHSTTIYRLIRDGQLPSALEYIRENGINAEGFPILCNLDEYSPVGIKIPIHKRIGDRQFIIPYITAVIAYMNGDQDIDRFLSEVSGMDGLNEVEFFQAIFADEKLNRKSSSSNQQEHEMFILVNDICRAIHSGMYEQALEILNRHSKEIKAFF